MPPFLSRRRAVLVAVVASAALIPLATPLPASAAGPPTTIPSAKPFSGDRTTGPLFRSGLSKPHSCTASVVASASHDLVITAAHCLSGKVNGWTFAPGYLAGKTPYGTWSVENAYLPSAWLARQDSRDDFAVLQLARTRQHGRSVGVQDVVGANTLAHPHSGQRVSVPAYNSGRNDKPIVCSAPLYWTSSYPTFACHGYVGGSSGSPWLIKPANSAHNSLVGVIGGLHQGGCLDYVSYSSRFDDGVAQLVARASAHHHPDVPPRPGSDGC